jgi:REP element-mobilizing transposase RayT
MDKYNPNNHHRRSIRLKGYDYSWVGMYFVTICVQHRECLFGEITDGKMVLNDAGQMVKKWCMELSHKFPDILLDTHVIMPNHFHAIVVNTGIVVGAHLCVRPDEMGGVRPHETVCVRPHETVCVRPHETVCVHPHEMGCVHPDETDARTIRGEHVDACIIRGEHVDARIRDAHVDARIRDEHVDACIIRDEHVDARIWGEHIGSPLHRVIQWFKTMTTNEYIRGVKTLGWKPFDKKLWQRNYYEHIVRDERAYQNISGYIVNNPLMWSSDDFFAV